MNTRSLVPIFLGIALLALAPAARAQTAALTPYDLRCDSAENPLGIDSAAPRLSWKLRSEIRGARQTAWQVLVASSEDQLARDRGDLWDSGRVANDEQLGNRYAGRALRSSERVMWKVRVWDAAGETSAWSAPATWTMGLLAASDWRAKWITPATRQPDSATLLARREFSVKPGLRRALIHVTGLGAYELSLNGTRIGTDLLAPGWTAYDKTVFYDTHDVTAQLHPGANAAGLFLGNGMYSVQKVPGRYDKFTTPYRPPWAIAQLRLEYADGAVDFVVTDEHWRLRAGPVTVSQTFSGEDHDARLEAAGWDRAGFDDSTWAPAATGPGPGGKLLGMSRAAPPLRAHETIKPVSVKEISPGVVVYDLGQNVALMPRLRVRGTAGSVVKIVGAELLKPDGTVDRSSMGGGRGPAWWSYTLRGNVGPALVAGPDGSVTAEAARRPAAALQGGTEGWFPRFFYSGCRYLQIERTAPTGAELPAVESLEGVVVHTSSPAAGEFACSDELFNRIRTLVRWAQRSNLMTLITDCPHREKLGWLEQYHLNGPSLRYEFDLTRLYAKCFGDMADAQLADGLVPDIAPEYVVFKGGFRDSPEWGSAFILAAWQHYSWTKDDAPLREYFPAMRRYVAYLASKATDHILAHGLGDWYDIGPKPPGEAQLTPKALTATAFYYEATVRLSAIASVLGLRAEAIELFAESSKIQAAFNRRFYDRGAGSYATGSQCANALPLVMGLAEPKERPRILDALVRDVQAQGLTAGDVGYRYLLRALAEEGRSDVIFAMNHQSEKPGYGYQLAQGATSLTEAWNADRRSSQNHFMLGQIIEWFYADLAGLAPEPAAYGWRWVVIRPQPVGTITWARASHESPRGKFSVAWKRDAGRFTLDVTVPPGAGANVFVPTREPTKVTESGGPVSGARGVRVLPAEEGAAVFSVESGHYVFVAPQ